jgi:hypothetical protein
MVALMALAGGACEGNPTVGGPPRTAAPLPVTTASVPPATVTTTVPADTTGTAGSSTSSTGATTTSSRYLGPTATFRASGRTLEVKPSDHRKAYAALGDQLPVPQNIQVEFGAPSAETVVATVVARNTWDGGDGGQALDVAATGEPGRWIWRAELDPGDYGIEATFTITGAPVTVRAPLKVTPG